MKRSAISLFSLLLSLIVISACQDSKYAESLSPEASMATFAVHEDFEVQIFAAEPHIKDPVDVVFDENGVAYAVEMPDYPYKPEPGMGQGVIKKLMDTNGDGRIDASTVFAEGIADATSLMPWKGGLLVTAAPYIYYMKDLDGDGKADQKEPIFSGFFENNSEAQITNLRLGIDNWIYAANNGQRSEVTYSENPDAAPLNLQGADFRFRLDTEKFEIESGTAQFGMTFDDWGNKFFTQNTRHVQQAVIPRRYLERHGHLSSMSVNHNISDHDFEMFQMTPPPYWRAERTDRRNKQYQEQQLDRVEHAEDYFTGASGGTVYNGGAFPEGFYGNLFTGDVAGNLVHRDVLVADAQAPTQIARRANEEMDREFIASTDPWFRPTGFTVGPDGYLYLVDFYRQHIETPVSIPDDLKEEMDFMNGADKGRIYRILPKSAVTMPVSIDFSSMDAETLVGQLAHQNGWWRSTAQRLILEEPKQEYIPYLEALAVGVQPQSRILALYLLQTMGALQQGLVESALESNHPGLVKNALILAEDYAALQAAIAKKTTDPSQMVALQAILSLGNQEDAFVRKNLAASLVEKGRNKWFRTAILSSNAGSGPEILAILDKEHGFFENSESWKKDYISEVAHILGAKGEEESIKSYVDLLASLPDTVRDEWQGVALEGLQKGLEKSASRHSETLSSLKTQLEATSNPSGIHLKDLVALL